MSSAPERASVDRRVTVSPDTFAFVHYDPDTIARVATEMAELLGVTDPIHVVVDETTPLSKLSADVEVDAGSSAPMITLHVESGALEDTQRFTHFGEHNARESLGRVLLRARDRRRGDFTPAPADRELTNRQSAAWDAYCAGRLARTGMAVNQQRWRYNFRNRFGFSDEVDAVFERLWVADDLSWSDLDAVAGSLGE